MGEFNRWPERACRAGGGTCGPEGAPLSIQRSIRASDSALSCRRVSQQETPGLSPGVGHYRGGENGIRTHGGVLPPHSLSRRAPSANSVISPDAQGGGGSRIRTHGGVTLNGFQDRRFRPLSHPSNFVTCSPTNYDFRGQSFFFKSAHCMVDMAFRICFSTLHLNWPERRLATRSSP